MAPLLRCAVPLAAVLATLAHAAQRKGPRLVAVDHRAAEPSSVRAAAATRRPPHLIHIVVDDVGHNDLGYMNSRMRTPTIDALAEQGLKLDYFYAFKECAPSRGSILTGRYPYHFGYYQNPSDAGGVPLDFKMLPQVLRDHAGYRTHALGKWHAGFRTKEHTPTFRGFSSFLGYYHWGMDYFTYTFPPAYKGQTKCSAVDLSNNSGAKLNPLGRDPNVQGIYSMDLFVSEARRVIRAHPRADPLYLYVAFQNVHDPYEVPLGYLDRVDPRIKDATRRNFSAMISALDDGVASVIDELKEADLYNESIILLTSDNGGELPFADRFGVGGGAGNNWPLRGGKFSLWEGGIRARALLHSPLLPPKRRGKTYSGLVHTSDVYPTFASFAGIDVSTLAHTTGPFPLDGFDLSGALWGTDAGADGASARTEILHQPLGPYWDGNCSASALSNPFQPSCGAAILRWPYKLVTGYAGDSRRLPLTDDDYHRRASSTQSGASGMAPLPVVTRDDEPCVKRPCLFDISVDPSEKHDISSANKGVVQELMDRLWTYGADGPEPQPGDDSSEQSDAQCLKALQTSSWQPWE